MKGVIIFLMITMSNLNNGQFSFKIIMKLGVKDTNDK